MSNLTKDVNDLFAARSELHDLRKQAIEVLNEKEWATYQKTVEEFKGVRRYTERAYELDYDIRVDAVRRRLINEAGSVKRKAG